MCSHYQPLKDADLLLKKFGAPNKQTGGKYEMCCRAIKASLCASRRNMMPVKKPYPSATRDFWRPTLQASASDDPRLR